MLYHPRIMIEIDKSYPIRKYQEKLDPQRLRSKLRDISEDKLKWSQKILDSLRSIIIEKTLDLPYDLLEVHKNVSNSINYQFQKPIEYLSKAEVNRIMKNELDSEEEQSTRITETYLQNKEQYNEFDDVHMAQLIILLSELAKHGNTLWTTITMQITELKSSLLNFINEDGHIRLSERSKIRIGSGIESYIQSMNELIDKKRPIPGVEE